MDEPEIVGVTQSFDKIRHYQLFRKKRYFEAKK